jgi:hypothetical protein
MARRRKRRTDIPDSGPVVVEDRKDNRRDYKLDKTAQKTELIKAKGTRLKWLAILIGLIMAGFGAFKTGIFGG